MRKSRLSLAVPLLLGGTLLLQCAAPRKDTAAPGSAAATGAFLSSELASEAAEFIRLGRESLRDSLWFEASDYFDSAMIHLAVLEADSLAVEALDSVRHYQKAVQDWLVEAVTQAVQLGGAEDISDFLNHRIEEVPDSALDDLDSVLQRLPDRNFDLPLPNPLPQRVLQALEVFTGPGRGYFTRWMKRKGRYRDMILARLEERGMPRDLIYLAMVESGFNPKAWSHASASGIWQFISGTGRRYGLKDDWWADPRRDPIQSTEAALDYLEDLYGEFGDWHLAMAGYNCGENRIRRQLEKDSTLRYWDMELPSETRYYVPKILAAMIIGRNPETFGFTRDEMEPPLRIDTATVRHCLSLKSIAQIVGISEDSLKAINPAIRRWCTPPGRATFVLNLPAGGRDIFYTNYDRIDTATLVTWRRHIVARGDNLSQLAARFGVSIAAIQEANRLRGTHLRAGQALLIPLSEGARGGEEDPAEAPRARPAVAARYKVRSGETLYDLARRFRVSVQALRQANDMKPSTVLQAGKVLRIPSSKVAVREEPRAPAAPPANANRRVHLVSRGETLYSISRHYGVSQEDLKRWNGLEGTVVRLGQKLVYQQPAGTAGNRAPDRRETRAEEPVALASVDGPKEYYRVKAGDSLWDISQRFGCSVASLKRLNDNLSEMLRPGQKIRVR